MTPEERGSSALLFEQIDQKRFASPEHLPSDCKVIRFASLDTNLLWPFAAVNPYNDGGPGEDGAQPYGDRVLLRCIEKDWPADAIVDYYFRNYDDYKIDLARVAALDNARRRSRDAAADVPMCDLVDDMLSTPLFWSNRHPRAVLLNRQMRRLLQAGSHYLPEIAPLDRDRSEAELFPAGLPWSAIPIHPRVAADLSLSWFDPDEMYPQPNGSYVTHKAYVDAFVSDTVRARQRRSESRTAVAADPDERIDIEGVAHTVGPAIGIHPDGFSAPFARFDIEATASLKTLTVTAFYPLQHSNAGTIACTLGTSAAQAIGEPGKAVTIVLETNLVPGERATFSLSCSQTLNMFELGASDDNRDLGVLILKMAAD